MFPTPELQLSGHGCITGEKHDICRPFAMTLVVMTNRNFIARYTNCKTTHAEKFWVESTMFREHLQNKRPSSVHLFMKNHPCHHSGGNARRYPNGYLFNGKSDMRSCTEIVIEFYNKMLKPNGVSLHIHVASLYKAFWKNATREDDRTTSENSRRGLQLLLQANIDIDRIYLNHWMQLANLCTKPIKIENMFTPHRLRMDEFINEFIESEKTIVGEPPQHD